MINLKLVALSFVGIMLAGKIVAHGVGCIG